MIDWQHIDTALLDMDGTLLDLHFDNYFWLEHLPKRYAEEKAIPLTEAHLELTTRIDAQRGHLNWYCLDFWSQQLGLDIVSLKEEIQHLIRFRPQVEHFLQQLSSSRLQLIMVTNAHRKSLELKQKNTRIKRYFDSIVSAHDVNITKEDPAFWHALNQLVPFEPTKTLLIDDSLQVLHSARAHDIRYLLTILKPDTQQAARMTDQIDGFTGIHYFSQLNPENLNSN
jgi:5'-nucleotidase